MWRRILRHPYWMLAAAIFLTVGIPLVFRHDDWTYTYLNSAQNLRHGQSIYQNGDGFVYPPFAAVVALPFSFFPDRVASLLWFAVSFASLLLTIHGCWQLSGGELLNRRAPLLEHFIFLVGVLPGLSYACNCFSHGQTDVFIAAWIVLGCIWLSRSRGFLAATCFAVAAAMKGPALLWSPYLLWRRRPLAAVWLLVVFVLLNLAPDLPNPANVAHGPFAQWIKLFLAPMGNAGVYPAVWRTASNQSLVGCLHRWMDTTWAFDGRAFYQRLPRPGAPSFQTERFITAGFVLLLLLSTAIAQRIRPPRDEDRNRDVPSRSALEFAAVILLMLLVSPMAAKAQWGLIILPGFCLTRIAVWRGDSTISALLCGGLLAWMASQDIWGHFIAFFTLWYGAVLLNGLLFLAGCNYALWILPRSRVEPSSTPPSPQPFGRK